MDDAVAFYKSKAWADLVPQRDKATEVVRRYIVETEQEPVARITLLISTGQRAPRYPRA